MQCLDAQLKHSLSSDAPGLPCAQVLYTDVDTIFMQDINSCSLPSPRILSAAGEVITLSSCTAPLAVCTL